MPAQQKNKHTHKHKMILEKERKEEKEYNNKNKSNKKKIRNKIFLEEKYFARVCLEPREKQNTHTKKRINLQFLYIRYFLAGFSTTKMMSRTSSII